MRLLKLFLLAIAAISTASFAQVPAEHLHRETKVYFEANSSEVTSGGREVLEFYVNQFKNRSDVVFIVVGNTDTTGLDGDNLILSAAMANSIADAMIELGVHPSRIKRLAYGESNQRVQTPDDTAEPLNRRVEITAVLGN
jgi:outer membrane protein OmpA-like peptidoglycan-associated protein